MILKMAIAAFTPVFPPAFQGKPEDILSASSKQIKRY